MVEIAGKKAEMSSQEPGDRKGDGLSPELFAALLESESLSATNTGWLVLLAHQQQPPGEKRLAAFSEALGIDPYTATQWLRSPAPRVIRRVANQQRADRWTRYLADLHLRAFSLSEETLPPPTPTLLRDMTIDERGGLILQPIDGEPLAINGADLLCAVMGEAREEQFVEHSDKLGALGELARGRERVQARSHFLIDLHGRKAGAFWRLDEERMEGTGPTGEVPSVRIRRLAEQLAASNTRLAIHRSFNLAEESLTQTHHLLSRSSDVARRWLRAAMGSRLTESRSTSHDTMPAFELYSLLLAEETRQLGSDTAGFDA
jgi:hypothetical protein